jgi:hypothetical protein
MRFEGDRLRSILSCQTDPVAVRDAFGRLETEYRNPGAALALLNRGDYYGIGSARRIRFVQAASAEGRVVPWGAELDFAAPAGAEAHYITVRRGSPARKVAGASRVRTVKPGQLAPGPALCTITPHAHYNARGVQRAGDDVM